MVENLRTTKFKNGSSVPIVPDGTQWSEQTGPACCWYEGNVNSTYGLLYNGYVANDNAENIAPEGWHVATQDEWNTLTNNVDSLKYELFYTNGAPSSNGTGFSAYASGERFSDGTFSGAETLADWWYPTTNSYRYTRITDSRSNANLGPDAKLYGFSIRCVRDW
jgi:uncharacterized protein (TIGR02145 family)